MEAVARIKNSKLVPYMLILLGVAAYLWLRTPAYVMQRDGSPVAMSVRDLDGKSMSLSDLRGKVVLVTYWATWCPHCRNHIPEIARFYNDYQRKDVALLTLSADADPVAVREYMQENNLNFPVSLMTNDTRSALGAVRILPTSFLIDPHGRLRKQIVGQLNYEKLQALTAPYLQDLQAARHNAPKLPHNFPHADTGKRRDKTAALQHI